MDEAAIAQLGIGRKFQKPTVFENHTVEDNLAAGARRRPRGVRATLFWQRATRRRASASTRSSAPSASPPHATAWPARCRHGQKQWLEIGMLLAQDPKLLLVDEPVAGMTDAETETTAELLREIAKDHSVVVVEHDMEFVRALGVKVTVLHEGSVLAEGSLDEVSANERVDRGLSGAVRRCHPGIRAKRAIRDPGREIVPERCCPGSRLSG